MHAALYFFWRSLLPLPKHAGAGAHQEPQFPTIEEVRQVQLDIPPYGKRHGFVPRNPEDFGDGGAFPEIHISQFPLGMGRKENMVRIDHGLALSV